MWIGSTSEQLPTSWLPLGQALACTWPEPGWAGAPEEPERLPSGRGTGGSDQAAPGQSRASCCGSRCYALSQRHSPAGVAGLWGGCPQESSQTPVSKRRPNFHHQLPSTKAVPDGGNDKGRVALNFLPEADTVKPDVKSGLAHHRRAVPRSRPGGPRWASASGYLQSAHSRSSLT